MLNMTDNTQTICITCGMQSAKLYTRYKGDIIKIAHCVSKPFDRIDLNSLSTQVRTLHMNLSTRSVYCLKKGPLSDLLAICNLVPVYGSIRDLPIVIFCRWRHMQTTAVLLHLSIYLNLRDFPLLYCSSFGWVGCCS